MNIEQIVYFTLTSILLTLAPGPDILYLLAKSLVSGFKSGVILAAGLCSGLIVHTALVAAGIAAVINESPMLFNLLKYCGAAYLLYLAYHALISKAGNIDLAIDPAAESFGKLYKRGILMNILNPKVILFFLAFLPQFINPAMGSAAGQIVILGLIFGIQALIIFTIVAYLAALIRSKILAIPNFFHKMALVQAVVLGGIAGLLIIE